MRCGSVWCGAVWCGVLLPRCRYAHVWKLEIPSAVRLRERQLVNQRAKGTETSKCGPTGSSSSRPYNGRPVRARDLGDAPNRTHLNLDSALAGLCFAAIPFGSYQIHNRNGTLVLSFWYVFILLLGLNLAFGQLIPRSSRYPYLGRNTKLAISLVFLLLVPVLVSGFESHGFVAFSSFVLGTFGGILIGTVWRHAGSRLGFVDLGAAAFLVISAMQLAAKFRSASGLSDFHGVAVLDWGASNYIGGVMVVVSWALAARLQELGSRRLFLAVPALGIFSALLTLSQGATISATVGLLVFFWNTGRTAPARALFRISGVATVFAVGFLLQYFVSVRSQGGFDPGQNLTTRWLLFGVAWREFLNSPIIGTGWLALRHVTGYGADVSFAHNVVLSFLQMAGLFGAGFVVILVLESIRALQRKPLMGAAVVAALTISMSDPLFEGGVGAMVSWAVIMYASRGVGSDEKKAGSVAPMFRGSSDLTGQLGSRAVT